MTLSGTNYDNVIHRATDSRSSAFKFDVYLVDWMTGSASNVKAMDVSVAGDATGWFHEGLWIREKIQTLCGRAKSSEAIKEAHKIDKLAV